MKIKEVKFHNFIVDKRSLRSGIFVQMSNEIGQIAQGEISPLPGYSKESINDALRQLEHIKPFLVDTQWFLEDIHSNLLSFSLYPSVFFGIESVLMDLCDPKAHILCKRYALILGSPKEMIERSLQIHEEGFNAAKIKIGHLSLNQATEVVSSLVKSFRLRLDFNRKWSLKDTLRFCAQFPENTFEYLEEPVSDIEHVKYFPHYFALDESLRLHNIDPFFSLENFTTCIIKPTLHYPFDSIVKSGKNIVLSSSFESPLGIRQIEKLALRLHLMDTLHGLDTLRYFEENHDDPLSHLFLDETRSKSHCHL